jgi:hypothetical protein
MSVLFTPRHSTKRFRSAWYLASLCDERQGRTLALVRGMSGESNHTLEDSESPELKVKSRDGEQLQLVLRGCEILYVLTAYSAEGEGGPWRRTVTQVRHKTFITYHHVDQREVENFIDEFD